ncbi:MAG: hypothetical protein L3K08_00940 [Thermoplasmata archaeon]|nr:hypothetical protein [Thermoplasmata archaeon]
MASSDNQSVLIRGPAGSGKTMLAARLLSLTQGPKLWVSTRTSGERYPVVVPKVPGKDPGNIRRIDLSIGHLAAEAAGAGLAAARRNLMELNGPDDDAAWLPPVLREGWQAIEDAPHAGVVFDSWEGLLDLYVDAEPSSALRWETLERYLLSRFARPAMRLILLSERPVEGSLDYEVDSVLQTAVGELDERSIRVMTIPKLRGMPLDETIYPYTLDGGEFRYLARVPLDIDTNRWGNEVDPAPEREFVWPGASAFARAFGSLRVGGASLLEREEGEPSEISRMMVAAAGIAHVRRKGRVLVIPQPGVSPETIYAGFRRYLPVEEILPYLRILTLPVPDRLPEEAREILVPVREPGSEELPMLPYGTSVPDSSIEPVFPEATEFLLKGDRTDIPSLAVVDVMGFVQALKAVGRAATPSFLGAILRQTIEGRPLHVFLAGTVDQPLLDPFRNVVRPLVRLLARRGRVFALGNRPWTPAYVVVPPRSLDADFAYELVRVS